MHVQAYVLVTLSYTKLPFWQQLPSTLIKRGNLFTDINGPDLGKWAGKYPLRFGLVSCTMIF